MIHDFDAWKCLVQILEGNPSEPAVQVLFNLQEAPIHFIRQYISKKFGFLLLAAPSCPKLAGKVRYLQSPLPSAPKEAAQVPASACWAKIWQTCGKMDIKEQFNSYGS